MPHQFYPLTGLRRYDGITQAVMQCIEDSPTFFPATRRVDDIDLLVPACGLHVYWQCLKQTSVPSNRDLRATFGEMSAGCENG